MGSAALNESYASISASAAVIGVWLLSDDYSRVLRIQRLGSGRPGSDAAPDQRPRLHPSEGLSHLPNLVRTLGAQQIEL